MINLEGYTTLEEISAQERTICYRAIRQSDHKNVILKLIRSEYPTTTELASLQQDYQLARKLDLPGVIHAYDFKKYQNGYGLVLEDIGGITLKEYLAQGILSLSNFFKIAIPLIGTLEALHQEHIIHKDINPNNIIINPQTLEVKLTDFSHATLLEYEVQEEQNPNILGGTLFYMSPEQTGRMNRPIDYRTDFYSLGMTFYEMLTGQLPFQASDPIGWVYCHIAQPPVFLKEIVPEIPEMLAKIIHKLLAKMPEERYRSASGLKADLVRCEEQWRKHRSIESFELATNDINPSLHIAQKLYGREEQIAGLLSAFERTAVDAKECVLITGPAGIGKSSLVHEIDKPITRLQGFFINGKYDQLKRNIPFSGVIEAFRQLVQNWVTEPENKLTDIRKELLDVVGKSGQVLTDIIPELELIIGKQPKALALDPTQAQNRFIILFRGFVKVFAKREHPLVLFLDDLQWVDNGSLKLLEILLLDPEIRYLLVIGSYRDNEVSADHPFSITLKDLSKHNLPINTIYLKPLHEEDLVQMIIDTINCEVVDAHPLANLILRKTGGNPFFVNKFIKTIYQEKLLTFSRTQKAWQWDIAAVEKADITDSVVDLLINNIHKLSPESQHILKLASCIGFKFDLGILSLLANRSLQETGALLWEGVQAELIVPMGTSYRNVDLFTREAITAKNLHESINYKFSHDRIQQAANTLMREDEKQKTHLAIASILFEKYQAGEEHSDLFEILNHYGAALPLITNSKDKLSLAKLNLSGAKKARFSIAYQAAIDYLHAGIALLDKFSWDEQYELLLALHKELLECEYLNGDFTKIESEFAFLIEKAKTKLDKADLYYSKIKIYTSQGKLKEGTDLGLEALRLFDINISYHPTIGSILKKILQVESNIVFKNIDNINLEPMSDPEQLSILRILFAIGTSASSFNRPLFLYTTCMATDKVLNYGYTDEAPLALCAYAMLLLAVGMHKKALKFLDLARRVTEKSGSVAASARYHIPAMLINYLYYPVYTLPELAKTAYQQALEAGELIYGSWARVGKLRALSLLGKPIPELLEEAEGVHAYTKRIKYADYYDITKMYYQYYQSLQANTEINGNDLLNSLEGIKEKESKLICGEGHSLASRYFYLMGDYQNALQLAEKAYELRQAYYHHMMIRSEVYFYYALCLASNYSIASVKRPAIKKRLKKIKDEISKWSTLCTYNFSDKYLLIAAEYERIRGNKQQAALLYDQAIEAADSNNYIYVIALANERAAQFYLDQKKPKIAKSYMLDAHYYFYRWGALAKAQLIEKTHPEWFKIHMTDTLQVQKPTGTISLESSALDFMSVVKASQAISSEIAFDKLLQKSLNIALENAGADKALFISKPNDHFVIELEVNRSTQNKSLLEKKATDEKVKLPLTLLNAVYRTAKPIILEDAINSEVFSNDPYIILNKPKSILGMPIHYQSNLVGILYLENNLTTRAFTQEHLKVLNLLATQTAISLENARVYSASGRFVPHEFLQQLNKRNISEVSLGDNIHQSMSILFCDIRSFSSLAEQLSSAEAFELINSFFTCMEPYIRKQHGFIDKYIGDAIMALFNGAADNAVQAGVDMLKGLDHYHSACKKSGKPLINIGIGINTGELMLGIVGSENRIESTVIGDSVNIATRIETLNKTYGTKLLISDTTRLNLRYPENFVLRSIDKAFVKGKEIPIEIWEVCDADPATVLQAKKTTLPLFNQARTAYQEQNWTLAMQLFSECLKKNPNDHVAEYFLALCQQKIAISANHSTH